MYTCQCERLQMGQNNGVLFKEVSAFRKCPLIEVPLYAYLRTYAVQWNL